MRALLLSLLATLAFAATADARPVIIAIDIPDLAIADEPITVSVSARDGQSPLTGASILGTAESACRITSDGADDATGVFAPGQTVGFELPYLPGRAGVHLVDVAVTSGGCSGVTGTATHILSLVVSLPDLLPDLLPGIGRAAAADCPGAGTEPAADNAKATRAALLCLLNGERADAGLAPLREDRRLRKAATRHSRDMVSRHYFDHQGPSGPTLVRRLERVGYWPASVGENIGWGVGSTASPTSMVELWMGSDGHRANILTKAFKRVGIGIAPSSPEGDGGATFTTDFASRR